MNLDRTSSERHTWFLQISFVTIFGIIHNCIALYFLKTQKHMEKGQRFTHLLRFLLVCVWASQLLCWELMPLINVNSSEHKAHDRKAHNSFWDNLLLHYIIQYLRLVFIEKTTISMFHFLFISTQKKASKTLRRQYWFQRFHFCFTDFLPQ